MFKVTVFFKHYTFVSCCFGTRNPGFRTNLLLERLPLPPDLLQFSLELSDLRDVIGRLDSSGRTKQISQ